MEEKTISNNASQKGEYISSKYQNNFYNTLQSASILDFQSGYQEKTRFNSKCKNGISIKSRFKWINNKQYKKATSYKFFLAETITRFSLASKTINPLTLSLSALTITPTAAS